MDKDQLGLKVRMMKTVAMAVNVLGLIYLSGCSSSTGAVAGRSTAAAGAYHYNYGSSSSTSGESSAKEADRVLGLPGQPNVSFAHYAGYVTVNESHGRALFYWFFEAASNPSSKPLLLWLNGGPGCSSVGYGQSEELGPFRVNKDGASLYYNSYAWNNEANLLFIESPAGVGFSYSNTTHDYDLFGDALTALDSYEFLVGWLERFSEYKTRDFFISGESYAGHYIPQLAKVILDKNKDATLKINLKGILMGNALIDDGIDTKGIVDYAWSHAIISDSVYSNITMACGDYGENSSDLCFDLVYDMYDYYDPINIYSVYSDVCLQEQTSKLKARLVTSHATTPRKFSTRIPSGASGGGYDPCMDIYVNAYLNTPSVQQSLHATQTGTSFTWSACSYLLTAWNDAPWSMFPTVKELIAAKLRVWMYSGDWDGRIPVLSTRYSIAALKLPIQKEWYPWYYDEEVAGWTEVYEGMTYATIRGAGHMVPSFKPGQSLALLSQFLVGSPLPPQGTP